VIAEMWRRQCAEDPHPTPLPGGRGTKTAKPFSPPAKR
jgi:hypothetical protein